MLKQIKFIKVKESFKKLPRILGQRAFLTFLGFVILASIFGAIVFYKYYLSIKRIEPKITETATYFDEELYQKILKEREEREKRFEKTESKIYPDLFRKPEELPKESPEELMTP